LRFRAAPVHCARVIEYRPTCGGGSCARCLAALELDAVKAGGRWYCCTACAQGLPPERETAPPEPRLYHRPRRFFDRRAPKELRSAHSASSASK
jgi:hypothetical protein